MIKNYLLIALRNIRKHFTYSMINIFGLGLGLATCMLLMTWVSHELSYDRFHENADRIYRSSLEMNSNGQQIRTSVSPTALLPALKGFPEITEGVRVYNPSSWNPYVVKKDDKLFQEKRFYFADSTFFEVFSFPLTKGNPETALKDPNSVVLTKTAAKKYFGDEDPVGKTLRVNDTNEYTVTGLMNDVPANSFLQFDMIGSFSSLRQANQPLIWWSANYQTFVVVAEGTDIEALSAKTDKLVNNAIGNDLSAPDDFVHYHFMKLTDIHLRSPLTNEFEVVGNIEYVYIFGAIAALILLIACINYINLATARAVDRAREVGVRKVVGAFRKQLFVQFLGESVLITCIAFIVGFFIAQLALPLFNAVTGKALDGALFYSPLFLSAAVVILLLISLLSGAYPAMVITSFKPVSVLKGNFRFSGGGIMLRKALVVTQFCISVMLIVGTIVIFKQLSFIQNKKLGYEKEQVLVLPLDKKSGAAYNELRSELLRKGAAVNVGRATESPVKIQGGYSFAVKSLDAKDDLMVTAVAADTGFIPALNMQLSAGRNITENDFQRVQKDTFYAFVVNEALLKSLFLDTKDAIGKHAQLSGRHGEIVGVINDFHFSSLHSRIGPLVIFSQEDYNHIFVELPAGDVKSNIESIKSVVTAITPHRPFEYQFLDEEYDRLYSQEQRMGIVFVCFATLAIVIACLGLLGLVSFTAIQRTKEIGIRKVLGATAVNIILLITRDFGKLVIIAVAIGIPLAYYVMNQWLGDFAYRTNIGFMPVLFAALTCLLIAFGTAGYQAVKAALIDPAKTLRND
ncbi:MAG TPA: ABC transporter permease [Chryseosolibacter sp.]|nr:ABC transporter permease [Chryseosolibacter sp.]